MALVVPAVLSVLVVTILIWYLEQQDSVEIKPRFNVKKRENFLGEYLTLSQSFVSCTYISSLTIVDGCYHVYLDIGSNIGVQVRKLYQPELYPGAEISNVFNEHFGDTSVRNSSDICAVGFEPNPDHTKRLKGRTCPKEYEFSLL